MNQDWDNLIILDACRFDAFAEIYSEYLSAGQVISFDSIRSLGSDTREFLAKNFLGKTFHDTIYFSANPNTQYVLDQGTFHDIVDIFGAGWNSSTGTVHPETVVETVEAQRPDFTDKRCIIHFMQPHVPFIGDLGSEYEQRVVENPMKGSESVGKDLPSVWDDLRYGFSSLTVPEAWGMYMENLELTLPFVNQLLSSLTGRTVVTADHGNLFGERLSPIPVRGYGHPSGMRTEELVKVPWLVVDSESRRKVKPDPPRVRQQINEGELEERLHQLGYR